MMKGLFYGKEKNLRNLSTFAAASTGFIFLTSCTPNPAVVEGTKMNTAERLALGKTIYDNSCAKCHDLPNPSEHSARDWVGIMNEMAPKAKLNEEQHATVFDYIVSIKN